VNIYLWLAIGAILAIELAVVTGIIVWAICELVASCVKSPTFRRR